MKEDGLNPLPASSRPATTRQWVARGCLLGSAMCVEAVLNWQPVSATPLLYLPFGGWAILGFGLSWLAYGKCWRWGGVAWWCLALALHSEPVWSIPRAWLTATPALGARMRVVSLNCDVGQREAAWEVVSLQPEIVLFQETPSLPVVQEIADQLWKTECATVWTPECAIAAKGQLRVLAQDPQAQFVLAEWLRPAGDAWLVASIRLAPPASRLDLWTDDCRNEQAERAQQRTLALKLLVNEIARVKTPQHRILIGGDFNMVAHDRTLGLLRPLVADSFARGGVGWGDTVLNDFPFQRFDQIWVSPEIAFVRTRAVTTKHSDHRLVVCDLWP